jgi:D-alanine-D-alanine ligase
VSILTGLQATRGLRGAPNLGEIHPLYWTKSGEWFETPSGLEAVAYVDGPPTGSVPLRLVVGAGGGFFARGGGRFGGGAKETMIELDAVIICCHGGPGEDGTLQGAFDLTGIPYTGPTLAGALIGMDKLAFSALMASAWLQMLPRVPLVPHGQAPSFPGPYIVKPRFGGSSIGIDVVSDYASAEARLRVNPHLKRGAVLEPYQPELFDLQVGVRMWPEVQLSAVERPLRTHTGGEILDYHDKYVGSEGMSTAPRELPARISSELERQIRTVAPEVATLCGVRGIARIDFLSDGEGLYVNEVNTIPGSLARHLWIDPPLPFPALLLELLGEAIARPSVVFSTSGADGSVLRGAGSIGHKLG